MGANNDLTVEDAKLDGSDRVLLSGVLEKWNWIEDVRGGGQDQEMMSQARKRERSRKGNGQD